MTGSKLAAESGNLIFMVGGAEPVLATLAPLFQAMGKQVFHMGDTSKGQATKLAMNLQIALIYEGFAEALTLAAKLGVDINRLMPLVQASMVRSGVVDYKPPFIMKRDFSPNFPLRLRLKDIHLTRSGQEARVRCPDWKWSKRFTISQPKKATRIRLRRHTHVAGEMGGRRSKGCKLIGRCILQTARLVSARGGVPETTGF
jgi:hypothetical protein